MGITISPIDNKPLLLADPPDAAEKFGLKNASFTDSAIPKPKFLFFVRFVQPAGLSRSNADGSIRLQQRFSDPNRGIVFKIKQIDKPKFNIKTEVLHQYNKKRVIQTKIDYDPVTIRFHDDVGDQVLRFWSEYYKFYYGDGNKLTSNDWANDIVQPIFNEGSKKLGWGYLGDFDISAAPSVNTNNMHFLESIDLFQFYGGKYTSITLVHPKITNVSHDANDYSDGREGTEISMTFDYEGVIYNLEKRNVVGGSDSKEELFAFSERFFDPPLTVEKSVAEITGGGVAQPSGIGVGPGNRIPELLRSPGDNPFLSTRPVKQSFNLPEFVGGSVLGPFGFRFDSGGGIDKILKDSRNTVADSGIKQQITKVGSDLFSKSAILTGPLIAGLEQDISFGIDSARAQVNAAAFPINDVITDIPIGDGQSLIIDTNSVQSIFSETFGTLATLALANGIIESPTIFVDDFDSLTSSLPSMTATNSNGEFILTDIGMAILEDFESTNQATGVRNIINPTEDSNPFDTNTRLNDAEIERLNSTITI